MDSSSTYPIAEQTSKRIVLEPPLIKREPPLKRGGGDKRDWYIYPFTSSKLSERVPLKEPPLKRDVDGLLAPSKLLNLLLLDSLEGHYPIVRQIAEQPHEIASHERLLSEDAPYLQEPMRKQEIDLDRSLSNPFMAKQSLFHNGVQRFSWKNV
uniref:Mediator of RNA polymerase II transcription subunit 7 n=1 Tax=Angiostrongylus cantonensis TaxID=6313 RepID=A0A0K0D426_ANGCA